MSEYNHNRGFTLLEVLLTTAVAGFVLLGITSMITTLNVINDRTRDLTLANALAENKVESLRSIGFVGLPTPPASVDFTNELPASLAEPRSAAYAIASTPDPNIYRATITITYNDHGSQRELEYQTLIGELGVGQY